MNVPLQVIYVFFSRVFGRGAVFLTLLVLALSLSAEEIGYYGVVSTTAYTVVYLVSIGLRHAAAYYLGRSLASRYQVSTLMLFVAVALGGAAATGLYWIYKFFVFEPGLEDVALFSSLVVIPLLWSFLLQGIFLGEGDFRRFNYSELVPRVSLLFLVLACSIGGQGLDLHGAVVAFLCSNIAGAGYTTLHAWRPLKAADLVLLPSLFFSMVRYGFPLALTLALVIFSPTLSIYAAKTFVGVDAAGVFFIVYKVTDIFAEAATATGMVAFSRGVRANSKRRAIFSGLRAAWVIAAVAFVAAVFLWVSGDIIVSLLFDGDARWGGMIMFIVASSLPFLCFSRVLNPALAAQGYASYGTWVQFLTVLFNGLMVAVLGPILGVVGVSLSLALSRVVNFLGFTYLAKIILRMKFYNVLILRRRSYQVILGRARRALYDLIGRRVIGRFLK